MDWASKWGASGERTLYPDLSSGSGIDLILTSEELVKQPQVDQHRFDQGIHSLIAGWPLRHAPQLGGQSPELVAEMTLREILKRSLVRFPGRPHRANPIVVDSQSIGGCLSKGPDSEQRRIVSEKSLSTSVSVTRHAIPYLGTMILPRMSKGSMVARARRTAAAASDDRVRIPLRFVVELRLRSKGRSQHILFPPHACYQLTASKLTPSCQCSVTRYWNLIRRLA
jgi:hypothetical protein